MADFAPPMTPGDSAGSFSPAAPISTPEPPSGDKQKALVNVSIAVSMLEQALMVLSSSTEEGQSVLKALNALTKLTGPKQQELVPAEIQQLLSGMPGGNLQSMQAAGGQPGPQLVPGMIPGMS